MRASPVALLLAACSTGAPSTPSASAERPVPIDTGADTGGAPPPVLNGPLLQEVAGAVPAILRQPGRCFLAVPDPSGDVRVDLVGLATPARATWARVAVPGGFTPTSMFERGGAVYVAGATPTGTRLVALDARTGALRGHHPIGATSLQHAGGAFFDLPPGAGALHRYADVAAVQAGTFTATRTWAGVAGSGDAWLPIASVSPAADLFLWDPATAAPHHQVWLDGYRARLRHAQEAGSRLFLLDVGGQRHALAGGQVVSVADALTGANLRNVELAPPFAVALSCVAP